MEWLNALLAGFFFWLLLFHWRKRALARTRERAGALLLQVNSASGSLSMRRWPLAIIAFLLVCLATEITVFVAHGITPPLVFHFCVAVQFSASLSAVIPVNRTATALEVREHGVLHSDLGRSLAGHLRFKPWSDIYYCKWAHTVTKLLMYSRFKIAEATIAPEHRAAVTAALGRFVPVYDCEGTVLAQPERANDTQTRVPCKRWTRRSPFQFDLQSMLILSVVVACAANCYGLRYRRLQPQREAAAELEKFHPRTWYSGEDLHNLNFSNCANKPTDRDLMHLERLAGLKFLDLSGAPITDAALKHLYPLRNLSSVILRNTQVTQAGAEELQRALPNALISWSNGSSGGPFGGPPPPPPP